MLASFFCQLFRIDFNPNADSFSALFQERQIFKNFSVFKLLKSSQHRIYEFKHIKSAKSMSMLTVTLS